MIQLTQYGFAEEYQHLYDIAYRYCREKLYPLNQKMDEESWFPEDIYRSMGRDGLLGMVVPEEYGGPGGDVLAQCIVTEVMSYWCHSMGASWMASENLCFDNVSKNGSEEQKRKYLPGFADGSIIGAMGMTEPGAGSDALGSMRTTAKRVGDKYILNGRKMFITNGPVADLVLVYAKTEPDKGNHGISAFLVEKDFPGYSVAQKLDKMGWRGSPTGELVFEDCVVPVENLMGEENDGLSVMMSGLNAERAVVSFHALGVAQRALDLSVEYARTREQFNRPIGNFQLVQAMLADMYVEVETIRALIYQNVLQLFSDDTHKTMSFGEVQKRCAAAVLHAGRAAMSVLDKAVQVHGGLGFVSESEVNQLYRCGKILEIGAGTVQVRQMIVGKELVK